MYIFKQIIGTVRTFFISFFYLWVIANEVKTVRQSNLRAKRARFLHSFSHYRLYTILQFLRNIMLCLQIYFLTNFQMTLKRSEEGSNLLMFDNMSQTSSNDHS